MGLGRSQSARDLSGSARSWISDSASVACSINGDFDDETEKLRKKYLRKKTSLSESMNGGDTMREVMQHEAPWVTDLRSPDNPTRSRWRSLSPNQLSPESGNFVLRGDDEASETSRMSMGRVSWSSPRIQKLEGGDFHSPRSGGGSTTGMSSKMSRLSSVYDPRAKPGSYASEVSASFCSSLRRINCSASEDHLWRELFHEELEERKANRLRGEGKAIGSRGVHSAGIPWRQIPEYDNSGRMSETGDPYSDRRQIVKASGMTEKKRSQFSPRLSPGLGVGELMATISENCENRPPLPDKVDSNARQAWLDLVKQRLVAKYEKTPERKSTPSKTYSPATPSSISSVGVNGDDPQLHWTWRQMRKGNSTPSDSVKDSCPYSRIDSGVGTKTLQTLSRRNDLSPPSNLGASANRHSQNGDQYLSREAAEKVSENRRDWQLSQDKFSNAIMDDSITTSPRSLLSKSASDKCFSGSTVASVTNPVHSVKQRASNGARKPRWK